MKLHCGRRTSDGFTLIEMLVVIGVIGMLAAMLLPVLGKAREQGRRAQCLGNLTQLGQAMAIYANTFNDYLPGYGGWGQNTMRYVEGSAALTPYAGHQGLNRHMVVGYGAEDPDPAANLTPGRLNFAPVGLGILLARADISAGVLACASLTGTAPTWYGAARYEYVSAFPKLISRGGGIPLVTADGRSLPHVETAPGKKVTAVLSSYSYRNMPFYSRKKPDNAPAGWTYTADYPSLADGSNPKAPWVAEWTIEFTRPNVVARFMTPPFRTRRQLGDRAICADSFDFGPQEGYAASDGMARYHHGGGYNVLYGDGHVAWYEDDRHELRQWTDWADAANPGTDNFTISSPSGQRAWNRFDRAMGIDGE